MSAGVPSSRYKKRGPPRLFPLPFRITRVVDQSSSPSPFLQRPWFLSLSSSSISESRVVLSSASLHSVPTLRPKRLEHHITSPLIILSGFDWTNDEASVILQDKHQTGSSRSSISQSRYDGTIADECPRSEPGELSGRQGTTSQSKMTVGEMETYIDTCQLNLSLSELHQHQGMSRP